MEIFGQNDDDGWEKLLPPLCHTERRKDGINPFWFSVCIHPPPSTPHTHTHMYLVLAGWARILENAEVESESSSSGTGRRRYGIMEWHHGRWCTAGPVLTLRRERERERETRPGS